MPRFVQLTPEDCIYLIDLINEMDSETLYTERQRSYTLPKLSQIAKDGRSTRLARKDVEYLLELVEDDDLVECEQQRAMTTAALGEILALQVASQQEQLNRDNERWQRRLKRSGSSADEVLQEHFEQTS